MATTPVPIVVKRTCDEHLCRILANLRIIERIESGELRIKPHTPTRKTKPLIDERGRTCEYNQMYEVFDDSFPTSDKRHRAAKLHRHLTASLKPCASEKYGPKSITTVEGIKYDMMLQEPDSTCELCVKGDMIPYEQRFKHSKYKPGAPPPEAID